MSRAAVSRRAGRPRPRSDRPVLGGSIAGDHVSVRERAEGRQRAGSSRETAPRPSVADAPLSRDCTLPRRKGHEIARCFAERAEVAGSGRPLLSR